MNNETDENGENELGSGDNEEDNRNKTDGVDEYNILANLFGIPRLKGGTYSLHAQKNLLNSCVIV